jgi:hypothetical protein
MGIVLTSIAFVTWICPPAGAASLDVTHSRCLSGHSRQPLRGADGLATGRLAPSSAVGWFAGAGCTAG